MYDFSILKELNSKVSSIKFKVINRITIGLIVIGILLIIVLKPEDPTALVLLVFFSLIGFIVSLFILLLKLSKNYSQIMKNSISIIYHDMLLNFNIKNDSSYKISAESPSKVEFELFPEFLSSDIDYVLEDTESEGKLYKSKLSFRGNEQTRTIVFQGLYYISNIELENNFLYTSIHGMGSKIGKLITPKNYGKHIRGFDKLPHKKDFLRGKLKYANDGKLPSRLTHMINSLHESYPKQTIRVGVINKTFHISVDFSSNTPVIRKYTQKELISYSKLVEFDTSFLKLISKEISK